MKTGIDFAIRTQSLILHKMLTFTGTLNLIRFRENWDVVETNEFLILVSYLSFYI